MASQIVKRSAEVRTIQISFELMPEIVNGGTVSSVVSVTAVITSGTYAGTTVSGAAAWNSLTAYIPGNVVTNGGATFLCIVANTNQAPPNTTYWVNVLTLGNPSVATGGKIALVQISGGTNTDTYQLTCKVTTSGGSTLVSVVPVKVSDTPIGYTE